MGRNIKEIESHLTKITRPVATSKTLRFAMSSSNGCTNGRCKSVRLSDTIWRHYSVNIACNAVDYRLFIVSNNFLSTEHFIDSIKNSELFSQKLIGKWRLQDGGYFVQASICHCYRRNISSPLVTQIDIITPNNVFRQIVGLIRMAASSS